MSDLVINVRQLANYPAQPSAYGTDLMLAQRGGLGGAYINLDAKTLVSTALNQAGPFGVGVTPPAGASSAAVYAGSLVLPVAGPIAWNGAAFSYQPGGFAWSVNTAPQMTLSNAGALSLPSGTLTVARDPAAALEVATAGWVGASTVASFNGRRGAVTLQPKDVQRAFPLPFEDLATKREVDAAVRAAIQGLLQTYPAVWAWNGRVGNVWLLLEDIHHVYFAPGAEPLAPTPEADADGDQIATAKWVRDYIDNSTTIALQAWVTEQIAQAMANTVTSFNGRQGVVNLTWADVSATGAAPLASPNFSGIPEAPTANPGTSTAQLATTAFVQAAVIASTTGVVSFNTRTGAITLTAQDVNDAGGALLDSPNFTGTPAAPTAATGTATAQIATTAFVMNALSGFSAGVASFNSRTGAVVLTLADVTGVGGAPANSPALTGTPTAPTAANGTSTTQLATTAFVMNNIAAIDAGVTTFNDRSGAVTLTANDVSAAGGLVNPSPALSGTPTAPTAAPGDSSTTIATTAFVTSAISASTGAYLPLVGGTISPGPLVLSAPAAAGTRAIPPPPPGTVPQLLFNAGTVNPAAGGLWQAIVSGGNFQIQANTAATADFSTSVAPLVLTPAGALLLTGNATQALQAVPLQQLQSITLSGDVTSG